MIWNYLDRVNYVHKVIMEDFHDSLECLHDEQSELVDFVGMVEEISSIAQRHVADSPTPCTLPQRLEFIEMVLSWIHGVVDPLFNAV